MEKSSAKLSYWESRLLSLVEGKGCPICREIADTDRHYFFWFYNEKYCQSETLDALWRSLGFCSAHGAHLTQGSVGSYQVSVVHEFLTRRVLRALREAGSTRSRRKSQSPAVTIFDPCPPCREREERARRDAFWLAPLLEDQSRCDKYGRPGMLCFPHLRMLSGHASASGLQRLLTLHEASMVSAVKSLPDRRDGICRLSSADRQEVLESLAPALWLAVGHERNPGGCPSPEKVSAHPQMRDPVAHFLEEVRRGAACAVCLEVGRSWSEWIGWLNDAVARGAVVEDLLLTCPEHVWPTVRLGSNLLAAATAEKALGVALHQVRTALRAFAPPEETGNRDPFSRFRQPLSQGRRHRLRAPREVMTRALPCPVCNRLHVAEDRALRLLFVLVGDRQGRAAIEEGQGLCLKHLSRALALGPAPPIQKFLMEVEAAKLGRLHWELEEALRKVSWSCRAETRGTEGRSWDRAVRKFSGLFPADAEKRPSSSHPDEGMGAEESVLRKRSE